MIRKSILSILLVLSLFTLMQASYSAPAELHTPDKVLTDIKDRQIGLDPSKETFEYAHEWFYRLFGGFIFKPYEGKIDQQTGFDPNGYTPLAYALGFTNVLALFLAAVIVFYVMIGGAVHTAASGQVLGKKWSSVWLPLRTGIGLGLIMPMTGVGGGVLSVIQIFIIWLLLVGSNAATLLWGSIVEILINESSQPLPTVISADTGTAYYNMAKMYLCADIRSRRNQTVALAEGVDNPASDENLLVAKSYHENVVVPANGTPSKTETTVDHHASLLVDYLDKPVLGIASGTFDSLTGELESGNLDKLSFGAHGGCGEIEFDRQEQVTDMNDISDYYQNIYNKVYIESGKAVINAFNSMGYISEYLNNNQDHTIKDILDLGKIINQFGDDKTFHYLTSGDDAMLENSGLSTGQQLQMKNLKAFYKKYVQGAEEFRKDLVNYSYEDYTDTSKEKLAAAFKRGGWGQAGLWFLEYGRYAQIPYKAMNRATEGIVPSEDAGLVCEDLESWYEVWSDAEETCEANSEVIKESQNIFQQVVFGASVRKNSSASPSELLAGTCSKDDCDLSPLKLQESISVSLAKVILGLLSSDRGTEHSTNTSGMSSPFIALSNIGHNINTISFGFIAFSKPIASGLTYAGEFFLGNLAGSTGKAHYLVNLLGIPVGFAMHSVAGMINFLTTILFSIAPVGFTLAYLVPMMPLATWISLIISYLITVIESVVAAPLSVVQMVTPEGEGISGTRLERAMSLLMAAIFKPSLLIIGLVAAIFISYISFAIINEFFWKGLSSILSLETDVYYNNAEFDPSQSLENFETFAKGITIGLFDLIMILILYTMTVLSATKFAVSVMGTLPDDILNWFSSGVGGKFGNDVSRGLESGFEGGQRLVGGAVGQSIQSNIKSGAKDGKRGARQKKKEDSKYKKYH